MTHSSGPNKGSLLLAPGTSVERTDAVRAELATEGFDVVVTTDDDWVAVQPEDWGLFTPSFGTILFLCDNRGLLPSHYLLGAVAEDQQGDTPRLVVAVPDSLERPPRSSLPFWLANALWLDGNSAEVISRSLAGPKLVQQLPSNTNPYRGLVAFSESEQADFYGRDHLAESLVASLTTSWQATPGSALRLLTLTGPSGVGKSSLVFAGVLPRLRKSAEAQNIEPVVVIMKPGTDPLEALAIEMIRSESADLHEARQLMIAMKKDADILRLRERLRPADRRLILVVDQFEEVFTLCHDEVTRQRFVSTLLKLAAHPDSTASVVLTVRADFYGACAAYPELAHAISTSQTLVPGMSYKELQEAIVQPASARGVDFETGLVARMVADIQKQSSALPLLQFALEQIWRKRAAPHLTHQLFEDVGGVAGALAQRADDVFERLHPEDQRLFKRLLLRMVQPGEATEDTRRRVPRSELYFHDYSDDRVASMCDFLSSPELRLLSGSDQSGVPTLEITHEALLTRWPRFREWIDSERDNLVHRKRLELAASSWLHGNRDGEELLSGQSLTRTIAWIDDTSSDLTLLEQEFVVASLAAVVRSEISGPDTGLRRRVDSCRTLGRLLPAALRTLANDTSPEISRRAMVMSAPCDAAARAILRTSLATVGPEEFSLIVNVLSDDLLESVDAALKGMESSGISPQRLLAAGALLRPTDLRWPAQAGRLIDFLLELPPTLREGWIDLLTHIGHFLEEALSDRIATCDKRDTGVGELIELFLAVDPISVQAFSRVVLSLLRLDHHAGALRAFREVGTRFTMPDLIATTVDWDSETGGGWRAECLALLCLAGGLEAAISQVPQNNPEVLYQAASHISMLGLTRGALASLLELAETAQQVAFAMLILCETSGPCDSDLQNRIEHVFRTFADAFVHALAGLLISRIYGELRRAQLEREVATDRPQDDRDWWTVLLQSAQTLTFVRVRATTITVGSPPSQAGRSQAEAQWKATVSADLFVADRVVTIAEYATITGTQVQDISESSPTENHPVVSQTWQEAKLFADAIGTELGRNARLLTEVEWELACRAGSTTAYYFGDDPKQLTRYGWYLANSPDRRSSLPRLLLPNPFGLFDMHGGVYEWCHDVYGPYPAEPQIDYFGPGTGPGRVLRGGGYNYPAADCRSAYRYFTQPENRNTRIGIRVCTTVDDG